MKDDNNNVRVGLDSGCERWLEGFEVRLGTWILEGDEARS